VPDEVNVLFKELGDYDYRPAREVAEGDENTQVRSVIDVDILGHIFEQSIPDLEITSRQQQTQRTLLDWLRVDYQIDKPSNKLLAPAELDLDTCVGEVKRIRGKKQPLTAAGIRGLREEHTRSIEPAQALAAEALKLERTLSDLVNQAYGLTPKEIGLMRKTAPPRVPIPRPD
jgi:hypothetical protein